MIAGTVTRVGRAILRLPVEGPAHNPLLAHAAVDTGFNGFLALSSRAIATLGLPCVGFRKTTLASGAQATVRIYNAIVHWHGQPRVVHAVEVQGGALVGMSLLRGNRLTVDVVVNGSVRIEPIP
jgi:clan AA aspartic protease